jgi:hypothetical protein
MNTRKCFFGSKARTARQHNTPPSVSRLSRTRGSIVSQSYGLSRPVTGIALLIGSGNRTSSWILTWRSRNPRRCTVPWRFSSLLGEVVRMCGLFSRKRREVTFVPADYNGCYVEVSQCCVNMVRGKKASTGSPLKLRLARVFSSGGMVSSSQPSSPTSPQRHSFHSNSLDSLRLPARPQ